MIMKRGVRVRISPVHICPLNNMRDPLGLRLRGYASFTVVHTLTLVGLRLETAAMRLAVRPFLDDIVSILAARPLLPTVLCHTRAAALGSKHRSQVPPIKPAPEEE